MTKVAALLLLLTLLAFGPLIAEWLEPQDTAHAASPVTKLGGTGILTTTTYNGQVWPTHPGIEPTITDIYMILTEPAVNTATVTLQTSPQGANWFAHTLAPTLWSAVITDTQAVTRINVEGTVFRIVVTLESTPTLTPTFYIITH